MKDFSLSAQYKPRLLRQRPQTFLKIAVQERLNFGGVSKDFKVIIMRTVPLQAQVLPEHP